MAKPGETLARQLRAEADRIQKLGYSHEVCHELRREASAAERAQSSLDYSKRTRRRPIS